MKKLQQPDLNLLLIGGTRDLKMYSPRINELMILLIIFATNVDGGTHVEAGTYNMITRQRRI